jgi:long-subunit acyl-CoA synthetase (AMP-forming)
LIGHVCCVGDGRPYNSALIVLDPEFARQWAAHNGLEGSPFEQLAEQAKLRNAIEAAIEQANRHLARVEQVKRFTVLTGDWAPGGEELTPTMKLKRGPIAAKYAAAIDAMYSS